MIFCSCSWLWVHTRVYETAEHLLCDIGYSLVKFFSVCNLISQSKLLQFYHSHADGSIKFQFWIDAKIVKSKHNSSKHQNEIEKKRKSFFLSIFVKNDCWKMYFASYWISNQFCMNEINVKKCMVENSNKWNCYTKDDA